MSEVARFRPMPLHRSRPLVTEGQSKVVEIRQPVPLVVERRRDEPIISKALKVMFVLLTAVMALLFGVVSLAMVLVGLPVNAAVFGVLALASLSGIWVTLFR